MARTHQGYDTNANFIHESEALNAKGEQCWFQKHPQRQLLPQQLLNLNQKSNPNPAQCFKIQVDHFHILAFDIFTQSMNVFGLDWVYSFIPLWTQPEWSTPTQPLLIAP